MSTATAAEKATKSDKAPKKAAQAEAAAKPAEPTKAPKPKPAAKPADPPKPAPAATKAATRAAKPGPEPAPIDLAKLDTVEPIAAILKDPTRRRLLAAMYSGERNVTELCEQLQQSQPAISHHLSLMRISGLLASNRVEKFIYYSLTPAGRIAIESAIRIADALAAK